MEEEIISEIENHKVDEESLDSELDYFSIDQFITNEFEGIEVVFEQLEYKYHGLKAKREALYGN